jgi:hypothetical protein
MSKKILNKNLKSRKTPVTGSLLYSANSAEVFDMKKTLWLYRFVYGSRLSLSVVLLLLISFSIQSIERVYASEEGVIENVEAPLEVEVEEQVEAVVISNIEEEETSVPENADTNTTPEAALTETVAESLDENLAEILPDPEDEIIEELPSVEEVVVSVEEDTENTSVEEDEVLEPVVESDTNDVDVSESADEGSEVLEEEEVATTSDEIVEEGLPVTHEAVSVTQSDSEFSFKKTECTELATGSFYCLQPKENELKDALFSAPDIDGDLEIFLVRNGEQTQVTSNQIDDAAPYYDQNSNTLVWHRLLDDRFQIISYDPESGEETQISRTAENNMEPTRQGQYTVWQRWSNGGWNIILFDGKSEKQITKDNSHNVAPYIHGTLVVWNSRDQNGEKTIRMFDIESQTYVTVDDPEGMSVSNPRMVFVYDSLHPNGDIVTKGYDVLAKKFIDLDTLPRELPDEIPASDSTGETRALIQSKPTVKFETEESMNASSTPELPLPVEVATSSTAIEQIATSTEVADEVIIEEVLSPEVPPVEIDIEIEPFLLDGVPI